MSDLSALCHRVLGDPKARPPVPPDLLACAPLLDHLHELGDPRYAMLHELIGALGSSLCAVEAIVPHRSTVDWNTFASSFEELFWLELHDGTMVALTTLQAALDQHYLPLILRPLNSLGLPSRILNRLTEECGLSTIGDLTQRSALELMRDFPLSPRMVQSIQERLALHGLALAQQEGNLQTWLQELTESGATLPSPEENDP